jgi:hypothetical protein
MAPAVRSHPLVASSASAAESSSKPRCTPAAWNDLVGHLRGEERARGVGGPACPQTRSAG